MRSQIAENMIIGGHGTAGRLASVGQSQSKCRLHYIDATEMPTATGRYGDLKVDLQGL